MEQVECYGVFEITFHARISGNPFKHGHIAATFKGDNELKKVRGFYDGNDTFCIRFMPSFEGKYSYNIEANFMVENKQGEFWVVPPKSGVHGPVRTANQFHFSYEDGTPYLPIGTTCYAWHLQAEELQNTTLETLVESPFNKLRFCVFPKHYKYNLSEPSLYPYERKKDAKWKPEDYSEEALQQITPNPLGGIPVMIENPEKVWDYERFCPEYFRHVETCIKQLAERKVQADLILLHPYDRWGYSNMSTEQENFYLQYVIARFGAFHNVWWALANEYDLFRTKTIRQWEENARVLVKEDPYCHLRSIHNCMKLYDFTRAWITHCSIQRVDLYKTAENTTKWRERYGKPIVLDEIAYEGNISYGWGNISGEEMTRRFWEAYTRGGYGGHGETYVHPENILWWSHGGKLHGDSPSRIAFLKKIMEEAPENGLNPSPSLFDETVATESGMIQPAEYYLYYYGANRPLEREFRLPETKKYRAQLIDTWNMSIEECGEVSGRFVLKMTGKPYMAARFIAVDE